MSDTSGCAVSGTFVVPAQWVSSRLHVALAAVTALDDNSVSEALGDSPSVESAYVLWQAVKKATDKLQKAAKQAEAFLADVLPGGGLMVAGKLLVPRDDIAYLKPQHQDLIRVLSSKLADEPACAPANEDGEPLPHAVHIANVIEAFSRFGNPSWRTKALEKAGLDLEDYFEIRRGERTKVEVRG